MAKDKLKGREHWQVEGRIQVSVHSQIQSPASTEFLLLDLEIL